MHPIRDSMRLHGQKHHDPQALPVVSPRARPGAGVHDGELIRVARPGGAYIEGRGRRRGGSLSALSGDLTVKAALLGWRRAGRRPPGYEALVLSPTAGEARRLARAKS